MVQNTNVIPWEQTPGKGRVYATSIDFAIDQVWNFKIEGTDASGGSDIKYVATHVVIDNLANNALVTFQYGPFVFRVSPYTRKTFPILNGSTSCSFSIQVGTVNLIFATFDPKVPDDTNSVDSTSAGSSTVVYYHTQILNADAPTRNQSAADNNTIIGCGNTVPVTFQLLPVLGLNGYYMPGIYIFPYSVGLTIQRDAADLYFWDGTVNATSHFLAAGESCVLACDGVSWFMYRFA